MEKIHSSAKQEQSRDDLEISTSEDSEALAEPPRHLVRKFGVNIIKHAAEIPEDESGADSHAPETASTPESSPLEEVAFWNHEYNDTEMQFQKYSQTVPSHLRGDDWKKYRASVTKYENDLRYNYNRTKESTSEAMNRKEINNQYELARAEPFNPMLKPENSIEAASGIFYRERLKELNQAISDNQDTPYFPLKGDEPRKTIEDTWPKVKAYIDASRDYELRNRDPMQYQRARRSAHNSMIKQLNLLNDYAKYAHTTPFTIRPFLTNDFYYNRDLDPNHALERRVNFDRESVLGYFRNAFADQFAEAEHRSDQGRLYSSLNSEQD